MAIEFTDVKAAFSALKGALDAVSKEENATTFIGANDKWLKELEKANPDEEAKKKINTLVFLDQILRLSISSSFSSNSATEKTLGGLVNETRGYLDFSERFFSDLRKLTSKDQLLEKKAVEARNTLLTTLNQVQKWLLEKKGGTSPEEFGACTTQFLSRMQAGSKELSFTQNLFKNQFLEVAESELKNLTDAWGEVVSIFIEDAQDTDQNDPLKIGDPVTIANFFCIHNRLETLYGRLDTNVSLVN